MEKQHIQVYLNSSVALKVGGNFLNTPIGVGWRFF
jgi:hypothetical protein